MGFSALLDMGDVTLLGILGESVTYTPSVGSPVTVQGLFDAPAVAVDVGHAGVSTIGPRVALRLSDLPSDPSVDLTATITVGSTTYEIRDSQPDSKGFVVILLHEAA